MQNILQQNRIKIQDNNLLILLGVLMVIIGTALTVTVAFLSKASLFPFLLSIVLYSSQVYFEDKLQITSVRQISILAIVMCIALFFNLENWMSTGMLNFLAVLYYLFFLYPLDFSKIKSRIKKELITFISILFGVNVLIFNAEYVCGIFGYDLNDNLFDYLHLLLELSAIIVCVITAGLILNRFILLNKPKDQNSRLQKQSETTAEADSSEYIIAQKIVDFFNTSDIYLQSNFGSKDLCQEIGVPSFNQISNITQSYFNLSFNELLAKYRIAYAMKLLRDEQNWSITSVAESAGFRSFTTFNKYFVYYVGISASDYKDRNIKIS